MKHLLYLVSFLLLIIFGCKAKDEIDVVRGVTPVHNWDSNTTSLLDSLKNIPDKQKMTFIQKKLPHLTPALCRYVEERFAKTTIDSIVYSFGSGKAQGVLDAAGARHDGVFNNELIAYIWLKPDQLKKNPVKVFVRCLNGMFEIQGDSRLGLVPSEFVIQKDEGLCHHLDFKTSIWLAEKFHLPLFKGKKVRDKFKITPNQARKINTNKNQVMVLVYPGDTFRLFGGQARYTPARRR